MCLIQTLNIITMIIDSRSGDVWLILSRLLSRSNILESRLLRSSSSQSRNISTIPVRMAFYYRYINEILNTKLKTPQNSALIIKHSICHLQLLFYYFQMSPTIYQSKIFILIFPNSLIKILLISFDNFWYLG